MTRIAVCVLCIVVACVRGDQTEESSWADLEAASKIARPMPYRHFKLDIYELRNSSGQLDGRKSYAYTPAVELDHASAKCRHNDVTGKFEVLFRIVFWTQELESQVVAHLRQFDSTTECDQVSVIGFDKVMLSGSRPSSLYTLGRDWDNYRREQYLTFRMVCATRFNCDRLAHLMRSSPDLFSHLRVQFTVSKTMSRTRAVRITTDAIVKGKFFSQLARAFPAGDVYLTADDTDALISESAVNVAGQVVDDTELLSANSAVYRELRHLLVRNVVDTAGADNVPWQSVYWNDDRYRPDRSSVWINRVYRKSDNESQEFIRTLVHSGNDVDLSRGAVTYGSDGGGFRLQESDSNQPETDKALRRLMESRNGVEWRGDRFQPKPMKLSLINLALGHGSSQLSDVTTSITYATVGLSVNVFIGENCGVPVDKARVHVSNAKTRYVGLRGCPTTVGKASSCYSTIKPAGCYCFVWTKMSWSEASALCKSNGMELVSIESAEENEQLVKLYDSSSYAGYSRYYLWTSGSDQEAEGQWRWKGTGNAVAYHNWAAGEPNSKRWGSFLQVRYVRGDFVWNNAADSPQSWRYAFPICELNDYLHQVSDWMETQKAELHYLRNQTRHLADQVTHLAASLKALEAQTSRVKRAGDKN